MTIPTIHDNGTSAAMLTAGLCNAYDALHTAYDALKLTTPNGRDYYPQGSDAIHVASVEHSVRMAKIHGVMLDLQTLIEAIAAQGSTPAAAAASRHKWPHRSHTT